MAGKKGFVNPLTRSSESQLNVPAEATGTDIATIEGTRAADVQKRAKGRDKVFELTHQRFTGWVDKQLKQRFDDLAVQEEATKTALLDEAITLLLHKRERKPYTRQAKGG